MTPELTQVLIGLAIALPSFLLGYLSYQRSKKVDAIAAQSGIAGDSRAGIAQIIEGLNDLVDNLQEDNRTFREDIKYLTARLDASVNECELLRNKLSELHIKYRDLPNDT